MLEAVEYIRQRSDQMPDRYAGNCLTDARKIAELLARAGASPWLARIRKVSDFNGSTFHGMLIPLRFLGRGALAWTTHYVCCCDGAAYDPLVGEPIPLEVYTQTVFGETLVLERFEG